MEARAGSMRGTYARCSDGHDRTRSRKEARRREGANALAGNTGPETRGNGDIPLLVRRSVYDAVWKKGISNPPIPIAI